MAVAFALTHVWIGPGETVTEVPELAVTVGRRHIIKRPRLTRLLDETTARVILLVAPAGYGKTTLAREWLRAKPTHVWVSSSATAADVAIFALELARAASDIVKGSDQTLRAHMNATGAPQRAPHALADLLARELCEWPPDAWIAIDDYHLALSSSPTDAFLERLLERSSLRLILTSRLRPPWCTSRRLLYGEMIEVDRALLAMTREEAQRVVSATQHRPVSRLVEQAKGWPAIIGLAAIADRFPAAGNALPQTLHDYLAEELYQATPPGLQEDLVRLSLIPRDIDLALAAAALDRPAPETLAAAEERGFLVRIDHTHWELHPLLRDFLQAKLPSVPEDETAASAGRIMRKLIDAERWEEAFAVVSLCGREGDFHSLLEQALSPLLRLGRLETIQHWLRFASEKAFDSALLDFAEAEVAGRLGFLARSDIYAVRAERRMTDTHPSAPQLLI